MLRRWGYLVAAAAALSTTGPAQATDTATAWQAAGCPPEYVDSPANGIDSTVLRVSGGRSYRITYSADVVLPGARSSASFVDDDCQTVGLTVGLPPGGGSVAAPSGAYWLVLHHAGHVGFRCTVA